MRPAVTLCASLLALFSCKRTADHFHLEADVQPRRTGPVTVTLRLTDASSRPVTHARLDLEGSMTHAGMAPVFGTAHETGDDRYRGSLLFSMAGDWVILVHGRLADGTRIEREIPVAGVQNK